MNRYIIQYYSKTRVALAKRDKQQTFPIHQWIFKYPNLQNYELMIALGDKIKKTDNVQLHTGLNIIADIKAGSEEEARDVSKNFVETLLNLISFSTITYCDSSILVSVISITDGESHPFQCYVYPFEEQEILNSLIHIEEPTFGIIFNAYYKSSYKPRILRALTWLRQGIGEDNFINEFISYWNSLEVIKGILRRNLKDKVKKPSEWAGVERVFLAEVSYCKFNDIRNVRRRLFHGGREDDRLDNEFMGEIKGHLEPMRKALIFCIGNILGLEHDTTLSIANKTPHRIENARWSILKGNLKNLPREFSELVKNYPTIEAKVVHEQFSIDQEGKIAVKSKIDHHFSSGGDIKWELRIIEQWTSKDTGIDRVDLRG